MKQIVALCAVGVVFVAVSAEAIGPTKLKQPGLFPITISKPGSYILVTNLTLPNANTTAILVQADNVTIDLNGFSILGPTVCSGKPVTSCTPTGSGIGIDAPTADNTTVLNGTVQGMGSNGIRIFQGMNGRVDRVTARSNGHTGIEASMVLNSFAISNGSSGINEGAGAGYQTCTNCIAIGNAVVGLECDVVANSIGSYNGLDGISSLTVLNSVAYGNTRDGITNALAVTNSGAGGNGSTGIEGSAVLGSSSENIAANAAMGNEAGTISSPGIAGLNRCAGGPCP